MNVRLNFDSINDTPTSASQLSSRKSKPENVRSVSDGRIGRYTRQVSLKVWFLTWCGLLKDLGVVFALFIR